MRAANGRTHARSSLTGRSRRVVARASSANPFEQRCGSFDLGPACRWPPTDHNANSRETTASRVPESENGQHIASSCPYSICSWTSRPQPGSRPGHDLLWSTWEIDERAVALASAARADAGGSTPLPGSSRAPVTCPWQVPPVTAAVDLHHPARKQGRSRCLNESNRFREFLRRAMPMLL
jgi:hypothetical protein